MIDFNHNNCVLVGDIHGEPWEMLNHFDANNIEIKDSDVVLLGDIGLGFYYYSYHEMRYVRNDDKDTLNILEKWCKTNDNDVWLIRGNHDDPDMFNDKFFSSFKRVHYLKDGEIIKTKNKKSYLVVSGAISVDRIYRKENISYWTNEIVNEKIYEDMPAIKIDGVFAHTGPTPPVCEKSIFIESLKSRDNLLEQDIKTERSTIDKIIKKFKPENWYNGHYHMNTSFDYIEGCRVFAIDINTPYFLMYE